MKRPLFIIAISLILGILLGEYLNFSILLLFVIAEFVVSLVKNKKITCITAISCIVIMLTNSYVMKLNNEYKNLYREENLEVKGTVCSQISETDYFWRVTVKINSPPKYKNTKLLAYIKKKSISKEDLKFGNQLIFNGEYKKPEVARNYKGYDYQKVLKTKGLYGSLMVDGKCQVIKTNNYNLAISKINNVSLKIKEQFRKFLPNDLSEIAIGIILGDNTKIDEDIKEMFSKNSISHMLAVSGTHVSYIIMFVSAIFNKKLFGKKGLNTLTIISLIIFMIITNMSPSVTRAGITIIITIIASFFHRKPDVINAMSISLIYTIILNPFSIFNIGLQLSYFGTIGILLFQKQINEKFPVKMKIIRDNISVSVSANLATLPLTMYYFNTLSLNFILSNLIISPILGLAMILGLFSAILVICIPNNLASICILPFKVVLGLMLKIITTISELPITNIIVKTPSLIFIIAFYISLLAIKLKYNRKKALCVMITIVILMNFMLPNINKKFTLYFVDVGQGDCTLIQTCEGKKILIDGGGSANTDIGKNTLIPYLLDRKILKLDYIIISHFDYDHVRRNFISA